MRSICSCKIWTRALLALRGAEFLTILPAIRSGLARDLANADPMIQAVQFTKQVSQELLFSCSANNGFRLHDGRDAGRRHEFPKHLRGLR